MFQIFIELSDWRHFYGALTEDKMLLNFQRTIETALALDAPIKICYIRKDKPKLLLQEKSLCEKTKNSFHELAMMKLKTI